MSIESVSGVASAIPAAVPAKTAASAKAEPAKTAAGVDTAPISPRLRFDPTSGVVVTEFLNGGAITSQTPSVAALAYLRAGLSADGLSKTDENA